MKTLALMALAILVPTLTLAQGSSAKDESAIRARLVSYAEARNHNDAHSEALSYTPDGEFKSSSGKISVGRAEIEKSLGATPPTYTFKLTVERARLLEPTVAIADTTIVAGPDNGRRQIQATYVMLKRDGQWLIGAARVEPAPATPKP